MIGVLFAGLSCLTLSVLLYGCPSGESVLPAAPDVSGINADLKVLRAEGLFQAASADDLAQQFASLEAQDARSAVYLRDYIIQIPPEAEEDPYPYLYETYAEPEMLAWLADTVAEVHSDLDQALAKVEQAYRYHRHYLPGDSLPTVVTYSGVFGSPVLFFPGGAAVSLPMFMGRDFSAYKTFPPDYLPRYFFHRMDKEYLPIEVMDEYARARWYCPAVTPKVLDHMIHEGKLLYYLDLVFPETPDSLKIGYTANQVQWAKENEVNAWALILEEELLYNSQQLEVLRLIGEGPFTKGMTQESPGRMGVWLGWQIVREYMRRHPEVSFEDLLVIDDAQTILAESGWKPGR